MRPLNNSRGVSLIAALFIIVILAFMGVVFVSMISTGSLTAANDLQSAQALYVAEGGLENATLLLNTSTLASRITCSQVTGNANLTNEPLGQGQFNVIGATTDSLTTLNGAITSAATTLTVVSTAGFAASGRIMIDRELIDYSGITPGTTTTFAVLRGRDGTPAVAHANGAPVGQYQCSITATGNIPPVAAPNAKRTVQEGVQLQEGWAVGNSQTPGTTRATLLRWNGTTWADVTATLPANANQNLMSISMLSYADGWAVGNRSAATNVGWMFLRWNGSTWTRTTNTSTNTAGQGLLSVFMVSSADGWTVGGPNADHFVHWSAGNWIDTFALSAQQLNSVYMLDPDGNGVAEDGWAVGVRTANNNNGWLFYRWNGATWTRTNSTTPNSGAMGLMSVFMNSSADGWAVGGANGSVIVHWTGGVWANVGSPVAQALNSVYMLDTDADGVAEDGWAVGALNGTRPTILRWNIPCAGGAVTGTWNNCTASAPVTNAQLNSVYCVDASDCWAVGNSQTPGTTRATMLHWDGVAWSSVPAPATALWNLNGVYIIGPKTRPQAAWQEVFQ